MKKSYLFAILLASCASVANAEHIDAVLNIGQPSQPVQQVIVAQPQPYCTKYTQTLKIEGTGTIQKAYGTACRQPDGAWQLLPATNTQVNYVMRGNTLYYVPNVIIEEHEHEHREHHRDY